MLLLLATIRPLPLAGLLATVLLLLELNLAAAFWFSLHSRPNADTPTPTNTATTNMAPSDHKTSENVPVSRPVMSVTNLPPSSPGEATESTVNQEAQLEEEYQTLMALREQMEQTSSTAEPELKASPRQTIHDFRDSAGLGTISGETSVPLPTDGRVAVVTLAFIPPFPSTPEILADCEDERVDSVRVLQCQPLGAKIEVKMNASLDSDDNGDVILLWEAMLEKK
jgi:hypothetical protein